MAYYDRKKLLPWDLALSEKDVYIKKTYITPSTISGEGLGLFVGEMIFEDYLFKKQEQIDVDSSSLFFLIKSSQYQLLWISIS